MPDTVICERGHRYELDGQTLLDPHHPLCRICSAPCEIVSDGTLEVTVVGMGAAPAARFEIDGLPAIPGYELQKRLGQGGMGDVFLAKQAGTGRLVALKQPHVGGDLASKARFRGEAEAAARLQHPGIVQVYDVGEVPGGLFLVMEYCPGGSLGDRLHGSPLPHPDAARMVVQVSRAIQVAHQAGIIHRDLKPGNVLLASRSGLPNQEIGSDPTQWVAKVADFGLARQTDTQHDLTVTGAILGSPSYMAPEQALGMSKGVGPRADIYSLGAILYELLTGRPPFRGASTMETLDQVRHHEPVPPSRIQPNIPRNLETICLKCLQKAPIRRYDTAGELADDLERHLDGRPILARPVTTVERAVKWAKRNPYIAALASSLAAVTVALLVGGTVYHFRLSRERDRAVANLGVAMKSIDRMLTQVADEDLANEPRLEKKRRALLEEALGLSQELLRIEGAGVAVREQTGLAAKRVGDIQRLLGRYEEAEASYSQALGYLVPLQQEESARADFARYVAECHNGLGEGLRLRSRPDDAAAAYRRAIDIGQVRAANILTDSAMRKEMARARYNLGIVDKDLKRLDESQQNYESAIELMRQPGGDEAGQKWHLARALLNLGIVCRLKNLPAKAHASYEEAIQLYEALTAADADRQVYRHELAVVLMNFANLHARDWPPEATTKLLLRSSDLLTRLVADYRAPIYRADLANVNMALAGSAFTRRDWPEAERRLEEAVALNRSLFEQNPTVLDYRARRGVALGNLGRVRFMRLDRATTLAAVVGPTAILPSAVAEALHESVHDLGVFLKENPDHPEFAPALRQPCLDLGKVLGRYDHIGTALTVANNLASSLPGGRIGSMHAALLLARVVANAPPATRTAAEAQCSSTLEEILARPATLTAEDKQKLLADPAFEPFRQDPRIVDLLRK